MRASFFAGPAGAGPTRRFLPNFFFLPSSIFFFFLAFFFSNFLPFFLLSHLANLGFLAFLAFAFFLWRRSFADLFSCISRRTTFATWLRIRFVASSRAFIVLNAFAALPPSFFVFFIAALTYAPC